MTRTEYGSRYSQYWQDGGYEPLPKDAGMVVSWTDPATVVVDYAGRLVNADPKAVKKLSSSM